MPAIVDIDVDRRRLAFLRGRSARRPEQTLLFERPADHLVVGAAGMGLRRIGAVPDERQSAVSSCLFPLLRTEQAGRRIADGRQLTDGAQDQVDRRVGGKLTTRQGCRIAADRAIEAEVACRQDLFAAVAADVVDAAPSPAVRPVDRGDGRFDPREGDEAVGAGERRAGIIGIAAMLSPALCAKPKFGEFDMVPEDAVAAKLVQHDAPVRRDADRVGDIAGIGEGELHEADAVPKVSPRALRIDAFPRPR